MPDTKVDTLEVAQLYPIKVQRPVGDKQMTGSFNAVPPMKREINVNEREGSTDVKREPTN